MILVNPKERCKEEDPEGYEILFSDDGEEKSDAHQSQNHNNIDNDNQNEDGCSSSADERPIEKLNDKLENNDFQEEVDYITNDPVKKYQFPYDESVCMANKYPEVEAIDETKDIEVAPGEGKRPMI